MPMKMEWLKMEDELRDVLRDPDFSPPDALRCIDEIVARYTRRGNSMPDISDTEYARLANCYPRFFHWED